MSEPLFVIHDLVYFEQFHVWFYKIILSITIQIQNSLDRSGYRGETNIIVDLYYTSKTADEVRVINSLESLIHIL